MWLIRTTYHQDSYDIIGSATECGTRGARLVKRPDTNNFQGPRVKNLQYGSWLLVHLYFL